MSPLGSRPRRRRRAAELPLRKRNWGEEGRSAKEAPGVSRKVVVRFGYTELDSGTAETDPFPDGLWCMGLVLEVTVRAQGSQVTLLLSSRGVDGTDLHEARQGLRCSDTLAPWSAQGLDQKARRTVLRGFSRPQPRARVSGAVP